MLEGVEKSSEDGSEEQPGLEHDDYVLVTEEEPTKKKPSSYWQQLMNYLGGSKKGLRRDEQYHQDMASWFLAQKRPTSEMVRKDCWGENFPQKIVPQFQAQKKEFGERFEASAKLNKAVEDPKALADAQALVQLAKVRGKLS